MPARRLLFDEALRSAWRRVLSLWRPMAAWTLLVWAAVAVLLAPASSALLGWSVLRGPHEVIGNEDLVAWLFTPPGIAWLLLAGGLGLVGAVVRYAGLFQIVTDDLEERPPTVRLIALELAPQVPALFRLCLWAAAAGLVLLLPLALGLGGVYALFLHEHDINYYLAVRPPEWGWALSAAAAWGGAWLVGVAWAVGRSLLALPAYLDGHRPARVALRRAWKRTRGGAGGARLLRLLALAVGAWLLVRAGVDAAFLALGSAGIEWAGASFASVRPVMLATALYLAASIALDAVVAFVGFSFVATVLTTFYYENTDLHGAAPHPVRLRDVPARLARSARPWLRPVRLLAVGVAVALASVAASGFLLERVPELGPALVIAHRAGPPPAPENTLAALEAGIRTDADYAEIDVQRTRDGVVVVAHDADLMRVAGDPRRIAASDFADLRDAVQLPDDGSPPEERRLATLDEFLERSRGRIRLKVELKHYGPDPGLAAAVVERVRAAGMEEEVVLMSLRLGAVRELRRLAPEIPVGYVSATAVGDLSRLPVDFLAVAHPRADARLLRAARERGIDVHAWTVNRADRMAELVQRGVDGIITDDPALAVRVNEELSGLSPVSRLLLRVRGLLPEQLDAVEPERENAVSAGDGSAGRAELSQGLR